MKTEADFVAYLQNNFSFSGEEGIGDDTSVVKISKGFQLVTKDLLIEDVHFRLDYFTAAELALKSLAVNLSDIAAMGGKPLYFYVGLGCPKKLGPKWCMDFYNGLKKGCKQWQVELAGGDFSSSPVLVISITVIGEAQKPIYRKNAQTNDWIGITGKVGESAIGLKMLLKGIKNNYFTRKHKEVLPQIKKGQILANYVNAMIDVSDGLLIDLNRILTASRKGAHLDYKKIPVDQEMKKIFLEWNWNEYEAVLAGGEDYILLFTISQSNLQKLEMEKPGIGYHIVGKIVEEQGILTVEGYGKRLPEFLKGYDHFINTQ